MPLSDLLLVMNSSHHGLFHFQIVAGWQYWQTNQAAWRFALCAAHESIDANRVLQGLEDQLE